MLYFDLVIATAVSCIPPAWLREALPPSLRTEAGFPTGIVAEPPFHGQKVFSEHT